MNSGSCIDFLHQNFIQAWIFSFEKNNDENALQYFKAVAVGFRQELECWVFKKISSHSACQSDLGIQHRLITSSTIRHKRRVNRKSSETSRILDANVQGRLNSVCRCLARTEIGRVGILEYLLCEVGMTAEEKPTVIGHI